MVYLVLLLLVDQESVGLESEKKKALLSTEVYTALTGTEE